MEFDGPRKRGKPPHCRRRPNRRWSKECLSTALVQGQFVPFFQPKIDLATRRTTAVEVLARWHHPRYGILSPSEFIGVMERTGLIDRLFECMLLQSLARLQRWRGQGYDVGLAINISPLSLQNRYMPERSRMLAARHDIAPGHITFEVTETAAASDSQGMAESMHRLHRYGFKLSADDFGTGYSSLRNLGDMPFTELKIDRSFVAGVAGNSKSVAILESIVQLAAKLRLCTVAEGIETKEDCDLLQAIGCRQGQAFYFAKPMAYPELMDYLGGRCRNGAA